MSEKKRTTYKRGSNLDLPTTVDKSKYAYRWTKVSKNSDDYDPRGWEVDLSKDGKPSRRGEDLVLSRMPLDMFEEMSAEKDADRKNQIKHFFEQQAAEDEKDSHEFKKKGGKVKFEFKQE